MLKIQQFRQFRESEETFRDLAKAEDLILVCIFSDFGGGFFSFPARYVAMDLPPPFAFAPQYYSVLDH